MRNQTAPRKDKSKVLPHGIPELIRTKPERYGSLDFKVRRCFEDIGDVVKTDSIGRSPTVSV
jgi:hypothetical protein